MTEEKLSASEPLETVSLKENKEQVMKENKEQVITAVKERRKKKNTGITSQAHNQIHTGPNNCRI